MNLLASLRYLLALHEHRHFGRAAQACHITQPALSNALRALEREFGTPIVQRGRAYAGLTPEGEQVLATARRMLHEHTLLQQELARRAGQLEGRLRLGVVPTAVPVAARFAARLRERHPGIVPELRSMASQDIEAGLQQLTLDLGLGFMERVGPRAGGFATLAQYREHYYLVRRSPPGTAAADGLGAPLSWDEAAQLPLALLTPDMHNRYIVDAAFARAGATVRPALETDSTQALGLILQVGDLCSVLPGALVAAVRAAGTFSVQPLVRPEVATPVGFISLRQAQPTPVLQAALALARDAAWHEELSRLSGAL